MNDSVSIIILNYNGKQFLQECISSVLAQTYSDFELILFDNNSTDGSAEFIKEHFNDDRLKTIESTLNLGFAAGNNEALKYCINDLIVLLNNDTKAEIDWLKHLVHAMDEKHTIASSFVITKGIPEKYYESNGSVSCLMYNIMNVFDNIEEEFYPNGCSLIFRKSEIGEPFDNDYFYYSEDVYLGLKARFMGLNIKFVKNSVVNHFGAGSNSGSFGKTFYQERNRLLNLYSFFSYGFIFRVFPYIALSHTAKIIVSVFDKKLSLPGLLKAYLWFYINIPLILKKRKYLKQFCIVPEKTIISKMSSKVFNDDTLPGRLANRISYFYSRLAAIKPVEYYQKRNNPH
jgi:GT2 family glycosyltransferase